MLGRKRSHKILQRQTEIRLPSGRDLPPFLSMRLLEAIDISSDTVSLADLLLHTRVFNSAQKYYYFYWLLYTCVVFRLFYFDFFQPFYFALDDIRIERRCHSNNKYSMKILMLLFCEVCRILISISKSYLLYWEFCLLT